MSAPSEREQPAAASTLVAGTPLVPDRPSVRHPFCHLCDTFGATNVTPARLDEGGICNAVRIRLRAGARLFEHDTMGNAVYVVQSGIVKETMPGPEGKDCIVRLATRNHVVGLCALLGVPHRHSAHVMHPGTACRVSVGRIEQLQALNPTVIERLQRDWQQAVDDADRILADLGHGSGRSRLARALLYLRGALPPGEPLRLVRNDLAELLAITPVSVSRLLGEFRDERLLEERGPHCVGIDTDRLEAIASGRA